MFYFPFLLSISKPSSSCLNAYLIALVRKTSSLYPNPTESQPTPYTVTENPSVFWSVLKSENRRVEIGFVVVALGGRRVRRE